MSPEVVAAGLVVVAAGLVRHGRGRVAVRRVRGLAGGGRDVRSVLAEHVPVVVRERAAVLVRRAAGGRVRGSGFAVMLEATAGALGDGAPLDSALADGAEAAGGRWSSGWKDVERQVLTGDSLVEAMQSWARSSQERGVLQLATTIEIATIAGGGIGVALEGLATSERARSEVTEEARALTAQVRASAVLLVALPVVFTVVMALTDRRTATYLFTTATGVATLAVSVGLVLLGGIWMRSLMRSLG